MSATSAAAPFCNGCRREGRAPSMSKHGTSRRYSLGCRCGECCAYKARENREYVARNGHRMVSRECAECGRSYESRRDHRTRFCGTACANKAQVQPGSKRSRARARARTRNRRRVEALIVKAAAGTTGGGRVWVQGACARCGESFAPTTQLLVKYCSRDCLEDVKSLSNWISYRERLAIYERDGWACQICFEDLEPKSKPGSDWYPTLDHVVPRSKGGSDDPSNLRASHMWCNSVLGDGTHYTEDDLRVVIP